MSDITSFRDLLAWQRSMDLAQAIYEATEAFQDENGLDLPVRCVERRFRFLQTSLRAIGAAGLDMLNS
jgi:uncharacterized protein YwlG (UPF0340 family)